MANEVEIPNFVFDKGILTDVSPLQFPNGAVLDQENMTLVPDGARRRKGLDYEEGYVAYPHAVVSTDAITEHKWRNVNNNPNLNLIVQQVGSAVFFFEDTGGSLSGNRKGFVVDLTAMPAPSASAANIKASPISGDSINGNFVIVGRYIEPLLIEYDSATDTIATSQITILERDLEGVDDGFAQDTRPGSLTSAHEYNLANQGWESDRITEFYTGSGSSVYPSNADIWYFGKKTDGVTGLQSFDYDQIIVQDFGNAAAPKGRILRNVFDTSATQVSSDAFEIDTWTYTHSPTFEVAITTTAAHGLTTGDIVTILNNSFTYVKQWINGESEIEEEDSAGSLDGNHTVTVTGADTFTIDFNIMRWSSWIDQFESVGNVNVAGTTIPSGLGQTTNERPQVVANFAGRLWYAGIQTAKHGVRLYFTQTIERADQLGRCYQYADPTSEHISDLVDTDGGYLSLTGLGQVYWMKPIGLSLFIGASSGVHEISGPEFSYFRATSYAIRKVSNSPCLGRHSSVIVGDDSILHWSNIGIQAITFNVDARRYQATSITRDRIDGLLAQIPDANKQYVKSAYDEVLQQVYWLYSVEVGYTYKYDLALVLDVRKGAFFKLRFPSEEPYVAGITTLQQSELATTNIKLFTILESDEDIVYSELNNLTFLDWETFDAAGVDTEAFIVSGYASSGDPSANKYVPLIHVFSRKTETGFSGDPLDYDNPSSCLMQTRWNWHNTGSGNKWGTPQQVYRFRRHYVPSGVGDDFDDGEYLVVTRNKVRGSGRVLSLKFGSEEGKDMYLVGWSVIYQGPQVK